MRTPLPPFLMCLLLASTSLSTEVLAAAPPTAPAAITAATSPQSTPKLRVGEHPGRGRLVFDLPPKAILQVERRGDRLAVHLPSGMPLDLSAAHRPPRNVVTISPIPGGVEFELRPQAGLRQFRLGNRMVLDISDPPRDANGAAPANSQAMAEKSPPPGKAAAPPAQVSTPAPATTARPATAPSQPAHPTAKPQIVQVLPAQPTGAQALPTPPKLTAAERRALRREARERVAEQRGAMIDPPVAVDIPSGNSPHQPVRLPQQMSAAEALAALMGKPALAPAPSAALAADASRAMPPAALTPLTPPILPRPTAIPPATYSGKGSADGTPPAAQGSAPPPASSAIASAATNEVATLPPQAPSVLLRYPPEVGAALVQRDDSLLLAFDAPLPEPLAKLARNPLFLGATQLESAEGVVMRVPARALQLHRQADGWEVNSVAPSGASVLEARPIGAGLTIPASTGRVLTLEDPQTGLPLLVGTVRADQAVDEERLLPQLDLLPTRMGVAVLARADRVVLRELDGKFQLGLQDGALALGASMGRPAAPPTARSFDLPPLPVDQLQRRLQKQQADLVTTPPLARAPLRRALAETMLSLGLPQEAQAMLLLAREEDPQAWQDGPFQTLAAMAALLAGRLEEAAPLLQPTMPVSVEVNLWRALLIAEQGDPAQAAADLAAGVPVVSGYPQPMRNRLLPVMAIDLAKGGEAEAARQVIAQLGDSPAAAYARGLLAEANGQTDTALRAYAQASDGRNRRLRAEASRRAIDLQLASGKIPPAAAARQMEAMLYAWRGDEAELAWRLRTAALEREAGQARTALLLLRETSTLFPKADSILPAMKESFAVALEREPPLSAVALYDATPELLPAGARGRAALSSLVDQLAQLDLPARAAALLAPQLAKAESPEIRAQLGAKLAELQLAIPAPNAAVQSLQDTAATDLPPLLQNQRNALLAQAEAQQGDSSQVVARLRELGRDGAKPLAELQINQGRFGDAAATLAPLLPDSPLGATAQQAILRQASLLAMANDLPGLALLRGRYLQTFPPGPSADAFDLLTADPVRGLADLPRLQQEIQLFRRIPTKLQKVTSAAR